MKLRPTLLALLAVAAAHAAPDAPTFTASADHADALYSIGDTVRWTITQAQPDSTPAAATTATSTPPPATPLVYRIRRDFQTVLREAPLDLASGSATIEIPADQPGALALEVRPAVAPAKDKTPPPLAGAGAFVAPDAITRSAPRPADFDAFWDAKLADLAAVPPNPELTPAPSDRAGVSRWLLSLDLPRGAKLRSQLARPEKGQRFPAIIVFQWAGVYALESWSVNGHAANGWLALNVSAHDLPVDQPAEFYKAQDSGPLKDYPMLGYEDREKSYFLRMFLATSRVVDYLANRPDWDGRTLVVTGTSQGGLQAIVAAGLNPKVTALLALVPAGGDTTASLADRSFPWPGWGQWMSPEKREVALRTSIYYDGLNFASRVRCPALIGYGLLDPTSTPSGVHLMTRDLRGPVERVLLPAADHKGDHTAYNTRAKVWLEALRSTGHPPDGTP